MIRLLENVGLGWVKKFGFFLVKLGLGLEVENFGSIQPNPNLYNYIYIYIYIIYILLLIKEHRVKENVG